MNCEVCQLKELVLLLFPFIAFFFFWFKILNPSVDNEALWFFFTLQEVEHFEIREVLRCMLLFQF